MTDEYTPRFDTEFDAKTHQVYVTDLARRAAQGEWSRRIMAAIEASPSEHAIAVADEVVRVVAERVWEMAYAVGVEDQAKLEAELKANPDPRYQWADRQNPFADIGWIKTLTTTNYMAKRNGNI